MAKFHFTPNVYLRSLTLDQYLWIESAIEFLIVIYDMNVESDDKEKVNNKKYACPNGQRTMDKFIACTNHIPLGYFSINYNYLYKHTFIFILSMMTRRTITTCSSFRPIRTKKIWFEYYYLRNKKKCENIMKLGENRKKDIDMCLKWKFQVLLFFHFEFHPVFFFSFNSQQLILYVIDVVCNYILLFNIVHLVLSLYENGTTCAFEWNHKSFGYHYGD